MNLRKMILPIKLLGFMVWTMQIRTFYINVIKKNIKIKFSGINFKDKQNNAKNF